VCGEFVETMCVYVEYVAADGVMLVCMCVWRVRGRNVCVWRVRGDNVRVCRVCCS